MPWKWEVVVEQERLSFHPQEGFASFFFLPSFTLFYNSLILCNPAACWHQALSEARLVFAFEPYFYLSV